jgi:hypothetical protein
VAVFPQLFRPRRAKWNRSAQKVAKAPVAIFDQDQRFTLCFDAFSSREPGYPLRLKTLCFSRTSGESRMTKAKFLIAAALLAVSALAPNLAEARHYRHHHYRHYWPLPYPISYLHNYGPGPMAGTFAYYDGPSTNHCYQGAATYLGQDRRRHPCF